MIFTVEGTTAYDGLEFGFEVEVEAKDEIEAKAKAILGQLRGDLYLEWQGFDGKPIVVRADADASEEDHEAEVAAFFKKYQGENYIEDWDYGDASAIHRIYQVREKEPSIAIAILEKIQSALDQIPQHEWIDPPEDVLREVESKLRKIVDEYSEKSNG